MCYRGWALVLSVLALLLTINPAGGQNGNGRITGRVSLSGPVGAPVYGDWVRVYLTTGAVAVPEVDLNSALARPERRDRINSGHMAFFLNLQQEQKTEGFIVDHKLTRPDGTFAFHRLPAGRYWVVVTFPTMIGGYKCAWQASVEVTAENSAHVELNNTNLVVPAY